VVDLIHLGAGHVAAAAVLILVNGLLSLWLGLGVERRLAIASVRTVVQLLVLGYVLVPVFAWDSPWLVLGLGLVMTVLAGREAVKRSDHAYRGIQWAAFTSLLVGCGATALLGTSVIIGVEPWWEPQYLVPLLGMVLGNALTGISIGLERCLVLLDEQRGRVEGLLAFGATWWEAARPVAAESLRVAMIPILNSMSVVGLVTIPGMMTGQLLAGSPPEQAARYQMIIMFMIAGSVALGSVVAILWTVRAMFDDQHRLRAERIWRR